MDDYNYWFHNANLLDMLTNTTQEVCIPSLEVCNGIIPSAYSPLHTYHAINYPCTISQVTITAGSGRPLPE